MTVKDLMGLVPVGAVTRTTRCGLPLDRPETEAPVAPDWLTPGPVDDGLVLPDRRGRAAALLRRRRAAWARAAARAGPRELVIRTADFRRRQRTVVDLRGVDVAVEVLGRAGVVVADEQIVVREVVVDGAGVCGAVADLASVEVEAHRTAVVGAHDEVPGSVPTSWPASGERV